MCRNTSGNVYKCNVRVYATVSINMILLYKQEKEKNTALYAVLSFMF